VPLIYSNGSQPGAQGPLGGVSKLPMELQDLIKNVLLTYQSNLTFKLKAKNT